MKINRHLFSFFVFTALLFAFSKQTFAATFDLIAPSGTLTRGQDVVFTINLDSQGASITSIQTGLTYDTQYLQYKSQ